MGGRLENFSSKETMLMVLVEMVMVENAMKK